MPNFKESAKRVIADSELKVSARHRDLDNADYHRAESTRMLRESLGEDVVTEWVAGLAENWTAKAETGRYTNDKYTIANLKEATRNAFRKGVLREANPASTLGALTTLGVEAIVMNRYEVIGTSYKQIATIFASDADTQVYGDTFRPGLPQLVMPGEQAPEINLQATGSTVKNYKWMAKLAFTSEIVEDDQTGKVAQASASAGNNMNYIMEAQMAAVLLDTPGTYGAFTFKTPAFQSYVDADGTTGVYQTSGLRQNKITATTINLESLRTIETLAATIRQPDGQVVMCLPDVLWYHPFDRIAVETIIKSPVWPSSTNQADSGSVGIAGSIAGSVGAPNPMQGRYTLAENRLLPYNASTNGGAWGVLQKSTTPIILQEREALQVLMESPNAGRSFESDLVQWRIRKRSTFFVFPGAARYCFLGNTGV